MLPCLLPLAGICHLPAEQMVQCKWGNLWTQTAGRLMLSGPAGDTGPTRGICNAKAQGRHSFPGAPSPLSRWREFSPHQHPANKTQCMKGAQALPGAPSPIHWAPRGVWSWTVGQARWFAHWDEGENINFRKIFCYPKWGKKKKKVSRALFISLLHLALNQDWKLLEYRG